MAVIDRTTQSSTEKTEKTERLEARVTPEFKQYLQRAAAHAHLSLTDFLITSARHMAEQTIREHEVISLSMRDAQALMETLRNPGPMPATLVEAAERYKAFMGEE
jgi:uncharacterized protein (DUF1778 family)